MDSTPASFDFDRNKDWRGAFAALRRLLAEPGDTAQVFHIMRALNAGNAKAGYERLLRSAEGGRIAYRRTELAPLLSDPAYIARFPAGSVGAAYAAFLQRTGYSATGLADVSEMKDAEQEAAHPYMWFARRTRDVHDIWHVLTGYRADDPLSEASLVAFSYAQTGGLGWGLIALGGMVKAWRTPAGLLGVRAIREGYRNGRRAQWLLGEDYETLLAEPLDEARQRLRIAPPVLYHGLEENRAERGTTLSWG